MSPLVTMAPAATRATIPTSTSCRGGRDLRGEDVIVPPIESGCGWIGVHGQRLRSLAIARVHNAEHRWHKEQGRAGGEEQAADHGAAKRRILARLDRHRDPADGH